MSEEIIPVLEVEKDPFILSLEAQIAVDAALKTIEGRTFSERHPELGKMINCQFCGVRHRVNERKCEQVFTYRVGDYELFRMDEKKNELVPAHRTAISPDTKPTMRQVVGSAAFAKKRHNPHPNRRTLQFIRLVRKLVPSEYTKEELEAARKTARQLLGLNKTFKDRLPRRKGWVVNKEEKQ